MHQLYAEQAVSVTELKRHYARVLAEAENGPVVVLNNNRPEAYLVPSEAYERLMERLEDLEDALTVISRKGEETIPVTLEELASW
ncbi:MAG: type II toxin-antitoxin system Phd/YefM family antitoxin [Deltaproteobacteria bacterium]|jgi:antitoxin StbD|nr:type II toxin-antitoxin system Phd/YefM family antitoxin [Deltaproteobacteria bacterium]